MFYTCVLKAKVATDDIVNVFYYRDANFFTWPNTVMGGAEGLANAFKDDVLSKIRLILPNSWDPQQIVVYPHNEVFEWSSQIPFTLTVPGGNEGVKDALLLKGNAWCLNLNYTVKPAGPQGGFLPPRRGYQAFGPIISSVVNQYGAFTPTAMQGDFDQVAAACVANISDLIFNIGQFTPIRVRHNRVLGSLVKWKSFADVNSASWSAAPSWRRSRLAE